MGTRSALFHSNGTLPLSIEHFMICIGPVSSSLHAFNMLPETSSSPFAFSSSSSSISLHISHLVILISFMWTPSSLTCSFSNTDSLLKTCWNLLFNNSAMHFWSSIIPCSPLSLSMVSFDFIFPFYEYMEQFWLCLAFFHNVLFQIFFLPLFSQSHIHFSPP